MAKAVLLLRERVVLSETTFADIRIWRVPNPVRSSTHDLKYSLALIDVRRCVLRYDNEAGKVTTSTPPRTRRHHTTFGASIVWSKISGRAWKNG